MVGHERICMVMGAGNFIYCSFYLESLERRSLSMDKNGSDQNSVVAVAILCSCFHENFSRNASLVIGCTGDIFFGCYNDELWVIFFRELCSGGKPESKTITCSNEQ